jgi:hypothetical protein
LKVLSKEGVDLSKVLLKSKGVVGYCRLKVLPKEGIDLSKDLLESKGEVAYCRLKVEALTCQKT